MLQGRDPKFLPRPGIVNLGRAGWIPNLITVGWAFVIAIFYDLPTGLPVTVGRKSIFLRT